MAKGYVKYDRKTIAAVVSAILAGTSPKEIQDTYGPSRSTQDRWLREYGDPAKLDEIKNEKSVGELMLEYASVSLQGLITQIKVTSDQDWIVSQQADHLAIFHGVMADKSARIVETLARIERYQREYENRQALTVE